jgi:ABC-2 type transport system ATP-binding protein
MSIMAVTTDNLHKSYKKGSEAVSGLSLNVPEGSVYALLGRNGAGKSTTIRMITGQLAPDSGSIRALGLDPIKDDLALRRKTAYVSETPCLYSWMTVCELAWFVKSFCPEWNDALFEELVKTFELPKDKPLGDFSRGMLTKAALLAALCREPELLVLDDPTLGLDTAARHEFMSGVAGAVRETGRTVILSTHIIPEIEGLADHMAVIREGKLVLEGAADDLKTSFSKVTAPSAEKEKISSLPDLVKSLPGGDGVSAVFRAGEKEITERIHAAGVKSFTVSGMPMEEIFLAVS